MKFYDNNGVELIISPGIDGETWGAFRRSAAGGLHRCKAIPMQPTKKKAENVAYDYVTTHGGRFVPERPVSFVPGHEPNLTPLEIERIAEIMFARHQDRLREQEGEAPCPRST